jgi:hypothetical protein
LLQRRPSCLKTSLMIPRRYWSGCANGNDARSERRDAAARIRVQAERCRLHVGDVGNRSSAGTSLGRASRDSPPRSRVCATDTVALGCRRRHRVRRREAIRIIEHGEERAIDGKPRSTSSRKRLTMTRLFSLAVCTRPSTRLSPVTVTPSAITSGSPAVNIRPG